MVAVGVACVVGKCRSISQLVFNLLAVWGFPRWEVSFNIPTSLQVPDSKGFDSLKSFI